MNMSHFIQKRNEILKGIAAGAYSMADIKPGDTLFHYTSLEGLKGIIESGVFRATEYHFLNDEEEFFYSDKLLQELIDDELRGEPYCDILKLAIIEYGLSYRMESEDLQKSFYVVSFSKKQDNLTLWAEFASYGCNMELEPFEMFSQYDNLKYCGSVFYTREEQKRILLAALHSVLDHYTDSDYPVDEPLSTYFKDMDEQEIRLLAEPFVRLAAYYGMAMKDELYAAEEEYRLIFSAEGSSVEFRQKGNLMIPYIELPLNVENDFEALHSITLAPLNRDEMCKYSIRQFMAGKGLTSRKIGESRLRLRY